MHVEEIVRLEGDASERLSAAVAVLVRRAARGDLDAVVVASLTGRTAMQVARALPSAAPPLICLADTAEWVAYGHPYPTLDERLHAELRQRGAVVLRDYRSSSAGTPCFDRVTGSDRPLSAREAALFWEGVVAVGGEGLKTAVKSVVLATDNGLLRRGARVLALGGSGGREAAVVLDALGHADLLSGAPGTRLRVREILCLPG